MKRLIKEFTAGNAMLSVLAVVASFIVGGILIAVSSEDVQTTLGYITARPSDFFSALWNAVFGAYDAMFRGAIFNYKATSFTLMIKPITETLAYATPITMAGTKASATDTMNRSAAGSRWAVPNTVTSLPK